MTVRLRSAATFALLVILPAMFPARAAAADQYRRWLDNGKTITCADIGGGVFQAQLSNQDVEFANLPANAQFTINYIANGVMTPDGPYTVEQTSGTRAYGAFAQSFPSYPFTFDFRLDTIVGGIVVYRSSLFVRCTGNGATPVTPINVDVSLNPDRFRRWLDNGKVFTCESASGGGVQAHLNNQDVEFLDLPVDAQFTLNYVSNGVTSTDGPYTVEQTNGTRAYGSFVQPFASYPFTFQFRMDTLIGGVLVYTSAIGVTCNGDAVVPVTPVNVRVLPDFSTVPVPALAPLAMGLLGALLGALGFARLRRRG